MNGYGTLHEIALYVGRPVKTVRNWAIRGEIPTLQIGIKGPRLYHAATARRLAETREDRSHRRQA